MKFRAFLRDGGFCLLWSETYVEQPISVQVGNLLSVHPKREAPESVSSEAAGAALQNCGLQRLTPPRMYECGPRKECRVKEVRQTRHSGEPA